MNLHVITTHDPYRSIQIFSLFGVGIIVFKIGVLCCQRRDTEPNLIIIFLEFLALKFTFFGRKLAISFKYYENKYN